LWPFADVDAAHTAQIEMKQQINKRDACAWRNKFEHFKIRAGPAFTDAPVASIAAVLLEAGRY